MNHKHFNNYIVALGYLLISYSRDSMHTPAHLAYTANTENAMLPLW